MQKEPRFSRSGAPFPCRENRSSTQRLRVPRSGSQAPPPVVVLDEVHLSCTFNAAYDTTFLFSAQQGKGRARIWLPNPFTIPQQQTRRNVFLVAVELRLGTLLSSKSGIARPEASRHRMRPPLRRQVSGFSLPRLGVRPWLRASTLLRRRVEQAPLVRSQPSPPATLRQTRSHPSSPIPNP